MIMTLNNENERRARRLEKEQDYRVLRVVPPGFFNMPPGPAPAGRCILFLDVETTGLDVDQHRLIELALMPVWVDEAGEVVAHHKPVGWLQNPEVPLEPFIQRLTGLSDADLQGKSIDDRYVSALLDRADIIVAHNARFDRAWIERRYPEAQGKAWACSASEVDWPALGFEGRAQKFLLMQHGRFANAHRACDDVQSLFHLLQHRRPDPVTGDMITHLARLLEKSSRPTELVEAVRTPIGRKDDLKARGYRWNAKDKVWFTEIDCDDLAAERAWFAHQGLPPFRSRMITAHERHR